MKLSSDCRRKGCLTVALSRPAAAFAQNVPQTGEVEKDRRRAVLF